MEQDIQPCGRAGAVFEPDLAALSLSLSRRRSLSSLGLDFSMYALEMVVGKDVRECYQWNDQ